MWHCIVLQIVIVTILKDKTFLELSPPFLRPHNILYSHFVRLEKWLLWIQQRADCWSYWRIKRKINFWVGSYFQIMKRKLSIHVETPDLPIKNLVDQAVLSPFIGLTIQSPLKLFDRFTKVWPGQSSRDLSPPGQPTSLAVPFFVKKK